MRRPRALRQLWLLLLPLTLHVLPAKARAEFSPPARSVLVKLRAEGPHAVEDCAESLSRRGLALASATADRSNSLDLLYEQLGVARVSSVFRRPDGSSFSAQREALRGRLRRAPQRPSLRSSRAPADLAHVYRLDLKGRVDVAAAAAKLAADPHVEYAQPNHWWARDTPLDDPFLHSSGSWGQAHADQWGAHAIGAPEAWDRSRGEGALVAIVDTGVDARHPDLAGNLWVNPGEDLDGDGIAEAEDLNGIDDDRNGFVDDLRGWDFAGASGGSDTGLSSEKQEAGDADPDDENGHGTHVAGIVGARGDNGIGIAGVAPLATLMPVRVFPPLGPAESDRVWRGVLYAAENGADVINGSFSCGRVCRSNPLAEEVLEEVARLGAVFVTSAGNQASDVMLKSPERLREAIVVGATRPDGRLAAGSSGGLLVDVVAPGEDVLSLAAAAAPEVYSSSRFVGADYLRLGGTSMAAPHVSGVLAILRAFDPSLTPAALRLAIRMSALDLAPPGHDATFGAGLVQAADALGLLPPPDLRGVIHAPLPGDTLPDGSGPTPVIGSLGGDALSGYRLELGVGDRPDQWVELPVSAAAPFEGRALAELPIHELADGAYVLRLTLQARGGLELHEFTPFSVEHAPPRPISSAAAGAGRPDIAGRRVAWEAIAERNDGERDLDLFQGLFGRTGERPWVVGRGDQTELHLSRRWAAWRQGAAGDVFGPGTLHACRIGGGGACRPMAVAGEPVVGRRFDLSGSQLVLSEAGSHHLCSLRLGSCRSLDGLAGSFQPLLDRRRLVWREGLDLFVCLLGVSELCAPVALERQGVFPVPRAFEDGLLAYESGTIPGFDNQLVVCSPDAATGACPPLVLATRPGASFAPDVSGRRVVFEDLGSHGGRDVYFCELDRESHSCAIQRVTSDAADQSRPRIDGRRVVFEDDRDGVRRVAGVELPALRALGHRSVPAGRRLVVPIVHRDRGPPGTLSLRLREGGDPAGLGATVRSSAAGRGRFEWRPRAEQVGTHRFVVRATRPGGLFTDESLTVEVVRGRGDRHVRAPGTEKAR